MSLTTADKEWIKDTVTTTVIEAIQTLVLPQFEEIHRHFDRIEQRLDVIEYRLGKVERRLDRVERRLDRLEMVQ